MNPNQKSGNARKTKGRRRGGRSNFKTKRIVKSEIKKQLNKTLESKLIDQNVSGITPDFSTGYVLDLTGGMIRGLSANQMVGDSINPTHLRIKWACKVGDATNLLRIIVVQQIGGIVPTLTSLLQSVGTVNAPLSPYNRDNSDTFRVLFDEFYQLATGADSQYLTGDIKIQSVKLRKISYITASVTPSAGGIYFMAISDSAAAPHPTLQLGSRLYFKDA